MPSGQRNCTCHNVFANYLSFILQQSFQPLAHWLSPRFCPKENGGQWSEHYRSVAFLIHLPSGICTAHRSTTDASALTQLRLGRHENGRRITLNFRLPAAATAAIGVNS